MTKILTLICAMMTFLMANADSFSYRFNSTPLPQAIRQIMEDHPGLEINFIYNELENYKTSGTVNANDAYEALHQAVGLNPVTIVKYNKSFYLEALQRGKYIYRGKSVGPDRTPVVAATVMLLSPRDSTVLTYGITDDAGRFSIPCDMKKVIAKLSSTGYKTTYRRCDSFNVGTIVMQEKAVALNSVNVEADNSDLQPDRSIYIPTSRQKNASQTGTDLLVHMSIPQLGLIKNGSVVTNSNQPVALFIDYLPASQSDLQAMRTEDVKRVEFFEYPSDPRLQGNRYAINFIMQKYEYGGYVKALGHTNLISNPVGEAVANVRLQHKNMTYDVLGSALFYERKHEGADLTETFRLPQENGETADFQRYSSTSSSKLKRNWYFATAKATYNSDDIQASSQVRARFDREPDTQTDGSVSYTLPDFPKSAYTTFRSERSQYVAYDGYYFFRLSPTNSIVFTPSYNYSHTEQDSRYRETGFDDIINGASDHTNKLSGNLKYTHNFGKAGNLTLGVNGNYEYNKTLYTGSYTTLDRARSSRIEAGIDYNVQVGKVYGTASFAWDWDRLQFGDMIDRPSTPKASLSLQYAPNKHNSLSMSSTFFSWLPEPSFKSERVIYSNPFVSYTGNPNIAPMKSLDMDISYTWIPNNNYNLTAYASAWYVGDRYVYDYEASSEGVLRTIKQPLGKYAQGSYGIRATARFLDRSLVFTGNFGQRFNHNGQPYNLNRSSINWYVSGIYYLGNWYFSFAYTSPQGAPDGCMNGIWVHERSFWYMTVGWGNSHWKINAHMVNFTRWNYRSTRYDMQSKYYDTDEVKLGDTDRAYIQLVATYTFGFGKKVRRDNEPSVSGSASSGILK